MDACLRSAERPFQDFAPLKEKISAHLLIFSLVSLDQLPNSYDSARFTGMSL